MPLCFTLWKRSNWVLWSRRPATIWPATIWPKLVICDYRSGHMTPAHREVVGGGNSGFGGGGGAGQFRRSKKSWRVSFSRSYHFSWKSPGTSITLEKNFTNWPIIEFPIYVERLLKEKKVLSTSLCNLYCNFVILKYVRNSRHQIKKNISELFGYRKIFTTFSSSVNYWKN